MSSQAFRLSAAIRDLVDAKLELHEIREHNPTDLGQLAHKGQVTDVGVAEAKIEESVIAVENRIQEVERRE